MPEVATEPVLLRVPDGTYAYAVPPGATRCRIPRGEGVPPQLRGREFDRDGRRDADLGLPIFRPRSRQV